jgi:hypothetical protein
MPCPDFSLEHVLLRNARLSHAKMSQSSSPMLLISFTFAVFVSLGSLAASVFAEQPPSSSLLPPPMQNASYDHGAHAKSLTWIAQTYHHAALSGHEEEHGIASRLAAVKEEFAWSWKAYEDFAFGHDELRPVTQGFRDWGDSPLGLTILDNLDSLVIIGFSDEFTRALAWVNSTLSFDVDVEVSTFEMTIRALGGLLSAHALTKESILLSQATDLGNRLLRAFDTPTGLPAAKVNLRTGPVPPRPTEMLVLSEVGTLSLEFLALSDATGDPRYRNAVDAIATRLAKLATAVPERQLPPILMSPADGQPVLGSMASLGAGGDSYYEYLLKAWLQTGKAETKRRQRYAVAAQAIVRKMVKRTPRAGMAFLAELSPFGGVHAKQDHLACFVPGMLALGAQTKAVKAADKHMAVASELLETCGALYTQTPTGLAAEISQFALHGPSSYPRSEPFVQARTPSDAAQRAEFHSARQDQHSLLRPETVESLFIMWRLTHNPRWRELGWQIFEALRKHARLATGGYASIESVNDVPVAHRDSMESFWLAETLKYLFLLFSDDDVLSFDRWVFNTEAHPLPVQSAQ